MEAHEREDKEPVFTCVFFSKNSRCSCDCPIKLHSHLLAAYPRSVGGLEGRLRLAVWAATPRSCENRPATGTTSTSASLQTRTLVFYLLPEGAAACTTPGALATGLSFSLRTRPSSFLLEPSLSFFLIPRRGTHS